MKRRLIAGFLTLCMIVSLCPPSAFAVHSSASEMTEPETVVTEPAADTGAPEETAAPDPVPSEPQKEPEPTQPEETLPEGTLPGGTLPEGEEYSYRSISVGQTVTLTTGLAEGGSWTSDNLAAATVTSAEGDTLNALVYGVAAGVTTVTYAADGAEERWVVYVNDPTVQTGETTGETVAAEAPADSEQATVEDQPQGGSVLDKLGDLLTGAADTQAAAASITAPKTTIYVGDTITLTGSANANTWFCDYTVTWESSDTAKAKVSGNGTSATLEGLAAGTVTVTHTYCSTNGYHFSHSVQNETVEITVLEKTLTAVTVSGADTVIVGVPTQLTATAQPAGAEMNLTWESSDADTLTVTQDGIITGVKAGTATITVTDASTGVIATYNVTVRNVVPVTDVTLTGVDTMAAFMTTQLTANITPENADWTGMAWESSNDAILTVNGSGLVTAVAPGKAVVTLTVTSADGTEKTAQHTITVTDATESTAQAEFYYLRSPDKDPNSNETGSWGSSSLGIGTVNMTNATWDNNNKNCFSVSGRVVSWPSSCAGGEILKGSAHWTEIFNAYKSSVEAKLGGVSITADDVEYIKVRPYKISKNNHSTPDLHVDCTVEVKTKNVYTATYYLWDAGTTGYEWKASAYYKEGVATQPGDFDAISGLLPTKSKNGINYTFDGWYTNETRTGSKVSFPYTLNENTTFYAKYVAGYQVTYNLNGGKWDGATTFSENEGATVRITSMIPRKDGYTFKGWTTDDVTITGNTFTMPNHNVTLTAQWEKSTFNLTVNYVYEDGSEAATTHTETVDFEKDYRVPSPSITGYTPNEEVVSGTMPAEDVTVTVTYTANSYKVTYDYGTAPAGATTLPAEETRKYNESVKVAPAAAAPGYTFSGWTTNDVMVSADGTFTMPAKDVTLTGEWKAIDYTVIYEDYNETKISSKIYHYGDAVTVPANPTRAADETYTYEFVRWDKKKGTELEDGKCVGDVTYIATYTQTYINYTVTYTDGVDGEEVFKNKVYNNLHYGVETPVFGPEPVRTGYTFKGWNPEVSETVTGTVTYVARWEKDEAQTKEVRYTVVHNVEGVVKKTDTYTESVWVNDPSEITVREGTLAKQNYTGYKFVSMTPETTEGSKVASDSVITLTYVKDDSQTQPTKYTVRYTINGNEQESVDVTGTAWINDNPAMIAIAAGGIPTPADKFPGYQLDPANPRYPAAGTLVESGSVYKVNYVARNDTAYTVEHYQQNLVGDGYTQTDTDYMNGTTGEPTKAAAKDYPGFTAQSFKQETIAADGSTVVKIYYNRNTYTVTYKDGVTDETVFEDRVIENVRYGTATPAFGEIPPRTGYVFAGWNPDVAGTVTADATYTAKWTPASNTKYTVKHYQQNLEGDGYTQTDTDYLNGTTGDSTAAVAKSYTGFTAQSFEQKTIAADGSTVVDIYYTRNTYTVSYDYGTAPDGATALPAVENYKYGADVTVADKASADGYVFHGWNKDGAVITSTFPMPAENVTITGSFTARTDLSYKVNYLEKGTDNVLHAQKVQNGMTFDDVVKASDEIITIDGYKYDSADKENLTITTGENVINLYYTKRTDLSYTVNYLEKDTNKVLQAQKVEENVTFGDVVKASDEIITIDGYNYDSTDKETLTITTGENVINLYYTKRTDLYAIVNYYWNGTGEKAAPSKELHDRTLGEAWTEFPIEIQGYTIATTSSKTVTIQATSNVINFYYYKNVELTANSKTETYNGTLWTVEGYTGAPADADFSAITVSASGTDAGTYDAKFADNTVGKVDAAGKYIVTAATDGKLTINPAAVTVTADNKSKVFGAAEPELTASVTGTLNGDKVAYTLSRDPGENVGDYTITPTGEEIQGNYKVTYGTGTLTITASSSLTVSGTDYSGIYDANAHGEAATASVTEGTTVEYQVNGGNWTTEVPKITNVGTVTVKVRATNPNYETAEATYTLTVTPASVTVTADNKTKVYGDTDPELTATVTGTLNGDKVAYTLSRDSGENVGDYTITPTGAEIQGNYKVTYGTGTLTITASSSLTVSGTDYSGIYDANAHGEAATASVTEGTTVEYQVNGGNWTTEVPKITNVGTVTVKVRATNSNYETAEATYTLTVTPASVTVTADNKSKVFGAAEPELTATVTGTLNGDEVAYTLSRDPGEDVGGYTITPTGEEIQGNYEVTYETGTLTITPVTGKIVVTVTGHTGTAVYDGTAHTVTGYDVAASNPLYTAADFAFDGAASVTGTDAGGYPMGLAESQFRNVSANFTEVSFVVNDGGLTVDKRPVTLTSVTDSKVYDRTPLTRPDVTVGGMGFVTGEVTGLHATGSVLNVSQGAVRNDIEFTPTAAFKAGNYTIEYHVGTLSVTPAAQATVVVSGKTETVVYDGKPHTVTGFTNDGRSRDITVTLLRAGADSATGTDINRYYMGLTAADFIASSPNYRKVNVEVVDGYLDIVTINVNVTITVRGNRDTVTYDGSEHNVTGYEIVSITTNVGRNVTMEGLTLKLRGNASATGTEPGTYPMGLTAADFDVDTTIYRGVRVVVEDGELVIESAAAPENEPTETIPDESAPKGQPEDIPDEDVPMAAPAWALLNLILSLLTILGSLFLLSGLFGKKKEEATDENGNLILDDNGESVMNRIKQRAGWRIISLLPAIGSVIAFILTENMRNPMVLVDRWTLLMVIIAVIQILVMMLSKKKVEETEEA